MRISDKITAPPLSIVSCHAGAIEATTGRRVNFSRRFTWEVQPNALSLARKAVEASGRRILDLTISNPTKAGIRYPEDLLAGLSDPRALQYDPQAAGLLATREAVAEYYADLGAVVHPDQIVLTASTSEAYHYLFKLMADPGDEILVPRPSYPLFEFLAGLELLDTVNYPTDSPDPCNLATNRTRALVTVHPNNPTGEYLTDAKARSLASRCAALRMGLIVDEVFLDYRLLPGPTHTMAQHEAGGVFVLSGLSKVCGMPQMKLGWMVLTGERQAAVLDRLELLADTYLSVSAPVQWASVAWLRRRAEIQTPILERIRENSQNLQEMLSGSGISFHPPQGGWTAVVYLPSTIDEEVLALRLLTDACVLVQPGYFYDFSSGARLVISLLTTPEDLESGIERLKAAI